MNPRFLRLNALLVASALFASPAAHAQRRAVEAEHGIVVSAQERASEIGAQVLRGGGNAVDAAVATGFALAVVYPWAGNLGGGGFLLVHLADGRDIAVDYRETAPAAATRDMYLDKAGTVVPGASTVGWRASAVPGTVAGLALALEKYGSGKFTWRQLIEPARLLAAEGHGISQYNAYRLRSQAKRLEKFPETERIYLNNGNFWKEGDRWIQSELAATLGRLQEGGPREFYEGETARLISEAMAKNGGAITRQDLAGYRAVERVPIRGQYRGYDIVTMPPPSSGGIVVLEMLGMLEPFDVGALGLNSSAGIHLYAEVMKRAFRDRNEYLGDPQFVKMPIGQLLDPTYLRRRMADFSPDHAVPAAEIQPGLGKFTPTSPAESSETTHFSIVDAAGNAAANTFTLNGGYGSGVTIPGAGFLMNNEMDDFTSKPGVPNAYQLVQGEANAITPGKRPLSSMSPTIVLKGGSVFLVTGAPGGSTISNTVLQVITNVIDHHMPIGPAVDAPRVYHQWLPDVITYEPFGLSDDVIKSLQAKGHHLNLRTLYDNERTTPLIEFYPGDAPSILVDPANHLRYGSADLRRADAKAVGY